MKGIITGITQNMSDLLNDENAGRLSAILSNTEYFALLSQSSVDKRKLMEFLPNISPAMFNFVDNAESGTGLLKMGSITVPFDMRMSKGSEIYEIVNTDGGGYGVDRREMIHVVYTIRGMFLPPFFWRIKNPVGILNAFSCRYGMVPKHGVDPAGTAIPYFLA